LNGGKEKRKDHETQKKEKRNEYYLIRNLGV